MSIYTTEVRWICEQLSGVKDNVNQAIQGAIPQIFNFDFPVDPQYKNVLCTKILKAYYTQEICEETFGLWQLRLDQKLNEIMPYFNQLYDSTKLQYNPLFDVDLTTTHTGSGTEHGTGTEKSSDSRETSKSGTDTTNKTNSSSGSNESSTTSSGGYNSTTTDSGTGKDITTGSGSSKTKGGSTTVGDSSGKNDSTNERIHSNRGGDTTAQSDTPQGALDNVLNKTYLSWAEQKDRSDGGTENTTIKETHSDNSTTTVDSDSDTTTSNNQTVDRTVNSSSVVKGDENEKATTIGSNSSQGSGEDKKVWSEGSEESGSGSKNTENNATTTEEYITKVTGKNGGASYAKMILEYRETLINIDQMILHELAPLFMLIY